MGRVEPIAAAQYLRISTENQRYSLAYQRSVIAAYAQQHDFKIVRDYMDAGKSGLFLKNRPGLMALLNDVTNGELPFRAILVYDVSRWGRFQDADEAAHYEFLCRSNGVAVHYCAEQFANDQTLPTAILKVLKRGMAAEYSRELSSRIYRALKCIAEPGFRTGAAPGYGYRRMLVDVNGKPQRLLAPHEWKSARMPGYVTLVLGPKEEIAGVRFIYRMLLEEGLNLSQITAKLRGTNIRIDGRLPSYNFVKRVLTNPKYAGTAAWGRTETKLTQKTLKVPQERWIEHPGAFPGIVDRETFLRAQQVYRDRIRGSVRRIPDQELLDSLRKLWKKRGRLSYDDILTAAGMPCITSYFKRFGSLQRAFQLIGYTASQTAQTKRRAATRRRSRRIRDSIVKKLQRIFPGRVEKVSDRGYVRYLDLNIDIAIIVCPFRASGKTTIWSICGSQRQQHLVTLLCLLNKANDRVESFYVFPRIAIKRSIIRSGARIFAGGVRIRSLRQFCAAVGRAHLSLPEAERNYQPEVLFGAPQIAEYLHESPRTVREWIRNGTLPSVRKVRPITVVRAEVDEWIKRNREIRVPNTSSGPTTDGKEPSFPEARC